MKRFFWLFIGKESLGLALNSDSGGDRERCLLIRSKKRSTSLSEDVGGVTLLHVFEDYGKQLYRNISMGMHLHCL